MDALALTLPEELMLLARRGINGRRQLDDQTLQLATAAAILAELALQGTIELRDKHVAITGVRPTAYLPQYRRIAQEPPTRIPRWIAKLHDRHSSAMLCDLLVEKGILAKTSETHLGIFTTVRYPDLDVQPDERLHQRIQQAIDGGTPDGRTAALIGLTDAAGLLHRLFPRASSRRLQEIAGEPWAPKATKDVVDAVTAEVSAAVEATATGGAT